MIYIDRDVIITKSFILIKNMNIIKQHKKLFLLIKIRHHKLIVA